MKLRPKRFLSLKWKAFIVTSIALLVTFALLAIHNEKSHREQFNAHRGTAFNLIKQEILSQIQSRGQELINIGGNLLSQANIGNSIRRSRSADLQRIFEPSWWPFQLNNALESVAFFSTDHENLGQWGNANIRMHLIQSATNQGKTNWYVHCELKCSLYGISPLVYRDKRIGAVIIGSSLDELVADLKARTGTELALATKTSGPALNENQYMYSWGVNITGATVPTLTLPVIRKTTDRYLIEQTMNEPRWVDHENRQYEVRTWSLESLASGSPSYWLIISDLTIAIDSLNEAREEALFVSFIGFILSELLLLLILSEALSRLHSLSTLLPKLTEKNTKDIRIQLKELRRFSVTHDESDWLNYSAIYLSAKLEQLSNRIKRKNIALNSQKQSLKKTNQELNKLVEQASVIVITQDDDGNTIFANNEAKKLFDELGIKSKTKDVLKGKIFQESQKKALTEFVKNPSSTSLNLRSQLNKRHFLWLLSKVSLSEDTIIMSIAVDISEQVEQEERVAWLAFHDPDTGLINRHRMEEVWFNIHKTIEDYNTHPGLILFEVFDRDQPSRGLSPHSAFEVKKRVESLIHESDPFARIGSNRFLIIIRDCRPEKLKVCHVDLFSTLSKLDKHAIRLISCTAYSEYGLQLVDHLKSRISKIPMGDSLLLTDLSLDTSKATSKASQGSFLIEELLEKQQQLQLLYSPATDLVTKQPIFYFTQFQLRTPDRYISQNYLFNQARVESKELDLVKPFLDQIIDKLLMQPSSARSAPWLLPISSEVLLDTQFLRYLKESIHQHKLKPNQLGFAIDLSHQQYNTHTKFGHLQKLSEAGFWLHLNNINMINFDLQQWLSWPINSASIDFLYSQQRNQANITFIETVKSMATIKHRQLIVTNVNTQDQVQWIKSQQIQYIQGNALQGYRIPSS